MIKGTMQELLVMLFFNQTYLLSAVLAMTFRARILKLWEITADLLFSAWNAAWSLVYLVFASFITVLFAMGNAGGYVLSDYASTHVHPFVCMLLIEFAMFLVYLFNYYLINNIKLKKSFSLAVIPFFTRIRTAVVSYGRPRFILLQ